MAKSFLIKPREVEQHLRRRYKRHYKNWLAGGGEWPLGIPLGIPTEQQVLDNLGDVKVWQQQWREWAGEGEVEWVERRWSKVGLQRLPQRISIHDPLQVVRWIGEEEIWHIAWQRYSSLLARWPCLAQGLLKYFKVLTEYDVMDFKRLVSVLDWLERNPDSNLYIRQLPIQGIHSKWLLTRKSVVAELLKIIRGENEPTDFYQLTGIRREPELIRFRLLDKALQNSVGGLSDITATVKELNSIKLPIKKLYIVENLQTGLAFTEIPGTVVFMGLGYAVDLYAGITWLKGLPIYYWGDIDTHGFAILNRLRSYFPDVSSILMDETTLLANRELWVEEETPVKDITMEYLTEEENRLYRDLCSHRWGTHLRLEQERIAWDDVMKCINQ